MEFRGFLILASSKMRRYSQTTITNVIEMIMHVSIAMDGVTQQVFAQKMTRIHVYAGHVNIICVLKKNQSLLKEPLRIVCLMELNLLRCIFFTLQ